jgi:hypothetical protein
MKFRRWRDVRDTKQLIKQQLLKPGMAYEDSIEDLEWWIEYLEGLT